MNAVCVWFVHLIERLAAYLNKSVFIIVAIYGTSYCRSVQITLGLLATNPLRSFVLNYLVSWFIWLMRVLVSVLMGMLAYAIFNNQMKWLIVFDRLYSPWTPTLVR